MNVENLWLYSGERLDRFGPMSGGVSCFIKNALKRSAMCAVTLGTLLNGLTYFYDLYLYPQGGVTVDPPPMLRRAKT